MNPAAELYLDLLKRCLTRILFEDETRVPVPAPRGLMRRVIEAPMNRLRGHVQLREVWLPKAFDPGLREEGRDWPTEAETMIGMRRLDSLQECVTDVIEQGVPGDVLEAGVWRGGAAILMRGVLAAHGDADRTVWVADSFEGLPPSDVGRYPADTYDFSEFDELAISLEEVRSNFARYGLLDERVCFLKGWFKDTLPTAPIDRLAVLRCDGDLYESTMDTLVPLYPKVSVGGYVIIDDYGALEPARKAVDTYRASHGITEPLHEIDWSGVYWRRER